MNRYRNDLDDLPTVLDRLLYQKPGADEPFAYGADSIVVSIARDLEVLLNSRRKENLISSEYSEACTSILSFGVPEFDHYGGLAAASERLKLCKAMENTIRTFEPRLSKVAVSMIVPEKHEVALRFRIAATIDALGENEVFEVRHQRDSNIVSVISGDAQ